MVVEDLVWNNEKGSLQERSCNDPFLNLADEPKRLPMRIIF